jgi:hypothetical protein
MQRRETAQDFFAVRKEVALLLEEDPEAAYSRPVGVVLEVLAVKDWWASPWTRVCDPDCAAGVDRGYKRYCMNRCGLIGRNILTKGRIAVELNGLTGGSKVKKT